MESKIIIIGGLPGTGKSTLASIISQKLALPVFAKDILEAAIAHNGLADNKHMNGVGYDLMGLIASQYVSSKNSVIFDFIASKTPTEKLWPSLSDYDVRFIECICSSLALHQQRIEQRKRNISGWYELNWQDVLDIKNKYIPYKSERLILDSVEDLNKNAEVAVDFIVD